MMFSSFSLPRSGRRLLAILVLPLALCAGAAHAQTMVSVDRDVINMRDGAGTNHPALWQLTAGYPLQVIGKKSGWLKVRDFEGDSGWVLGKLTGRKPHVIVKVPVANLRKSASTRSGLAGRAEYGDVLRTLKRSDSWLQVRGTDGATGWIARKLVWGW